MVRVRIKGQDSVAESGTPIAQRLQGARFRTVNPGRVRSGGVEVASVTRDSEAWISGLRKGDIILSVNRRRIKSFEAFKTAIRNSDDVLMFNLLRGDDSLFLLIQ